VRLGYSPGARISQAERLAREQALRDEAARKAAQQAKPEPPPNRPPVVKAQCDPCTVEVGQTSTLRAEASDPDGDTLTYNWTTQTGTLATPAERETRWTAPQQEGKVPATVTVTDGRGGKASDTVTLQVVRPPAKSYMFEDVHFDFDRYTLRPDATRLLDDAVNAMSQDSTLNLQIEGHTCNIGTAEYNLALGDRRANAVREYLISRGVAAGRRRSATAKSGRGTTTRARRPVG
jgi:outer membrane protein OmpA-like peptidoglycan-associated protein